MLKKLFLTICLFMIVLGPIRAQQSNLVVFSDLNEPFTLLVNNQRVNQLPAQNIKVTGLFPGWYTVRLVFNNPSIPQAEMSLGVEADREVTYAMVKNALGQRTLLFVNEFTLGYNPIAQGQQFAVTYNGPAPTNPSQVVPALSVIEPALNPPVVPADVPVTTTQTTTTTTLITTEPDFVVVYPDDPPAPDPLPGYNGPVGCQNIMDGEAFSDAKSSIASKSFSSSKMTLAKQITRANCLMSAQVREIMDLFDYETDRLNYAKFAYDFTYDQGNFYKVNDSFDFESSIRSLEEFLDGR